MEKKKKMYQSAYNSVKMFEYKIAPFSNGKNSVGSYVGKVIPSLPLVLLLNNSLQFAIVCRIFCFSAEFYFMTHLSICVCDLFVILFFY